MALASTFLRIRILATPLMFLSFFTVYLFQGFGIGRVAMVLAILRWAVFNIPMLVLLNALVGMYGILWIPAIGDGITVLLSLAAYLRWRPRAGQKNPNNTKAPRPKAGALFVCSFRGHPPPADELGADRDGDLGGGHRPDGKADGGDEAPGGVGIPFGGQLRKKLLPLAAAAHQADVPGTGAQRPPHGGAVPGVAPGHDADGVPGPGAISRETPRPGRQTRCRPPLRRRGKQAGSA